MELRFNINGRIIEKVVDVRIPQDQQPGLFYCTKEMNVYKPDGIRRHRRWSFAAFS